MNPKILEDKQGHPSAKLASCMHTFSCWTGGLGLFLGHQWLVLCCIGWHLSMGTHHHVSIHFLYLFQ